MLGICLGIYVLNYTIEGLSAIVMPQVAFSDSSVVFKNFWLICAYQPKRKYSSLISSEVMFQFLTGATMELQLSLNSTLLVSYALTVLCERAALILYERNVKQTI